jgi:hypothetical protein
MRRLIVLAVGLASMFGVLGTVRADVTGNVFVLGWDTSPINHVWRFSLDGTYLGDIAPNNSFGAIVLPGDGFLYGLDSSTGDFTRMNFDGSSPTPIDASPDPTVAMEGSYVERAHADGQGGMLITPFGYHQEPRTLVRYSTAGGLQARYTGMQHSGGIAGEPAAGLVFSAGSSAWDRGLYSFPWAGGSRTTLAASTGAEYDMAIDRDNDTLFLSNQTASVEMRSYSGALVGTLNMGQTENYAIEYDALTGYLFSAAMPGGNPNVRAVDLSGKIIQDYHTASMYFLEDVEVHTVPEPSTLVLLSMGAVGLLGYAYRRRKR